jgi:hypothetical protein
MPKIVFIEGQFLMCPFLSIQTFLFKQLFAVFDSLKKSIFE